MNYVKNTEAMTASVAIWVTLVLVALTMTCGMIHAHLKELVGGKMKIHQLKILDCFADEIVAGNKMFELRENDRGYRKGDYICFTVISDESGREIKHAINTRLYEITCVLSGWGLMDGCVALGIREANRNPTVHAHWIEHRANNGNMHYICSHCGKEVSYPYAKKRWKYCIECGAKMDEGKTVGLRGW